MAGDSPTFEAWPPEKEDGFIHQQILALWGMPLGEMWDFETLARRCREIGRWVVFVTSAPANVVGMSLSFSCLVLLLFLGFGMGLLMCVL